MNNEVVIHVRVDKKGVIPDLDSMKKDVETAGDKAGKEGGKKLGKGITDGAEGALRDAQGRFVKAGTTIGEGITDGAEKKIRESKDKLGSAGDDVGGNLGKRIVKSVGGALGTLGDEFTKTIDATKDKWVGGAVLIGAIMAPMLGSAISGAIVGGGAGLGVVGGMLLAKDDPAIKAAGSSLGKNMLSGLKDDAVTYFRQPMLQSIAYVKDQWTTLRPALAGIFKNSAEFVMPLTRAITETVGLLADGLKSMIGNAGPAIEGLSTLLTGVGGALKDMFITFGEDAEQGKSGLEDLTNAMVNFITLTTEIIHGLSEIKKGLDWVDEGIDKTRNWLEDKTGWDLTADGMSLVERRAKDLADANNNELAPALQTGADAADAQRNALRALADEMHAQVDPLFALTKAQVNVKKAQDDYNASLAKNGPEAGKTRDAMLRMGEAAFDLNTALGEASGGFDGNFTPAMRTALKNAGLTAGQIKTLQTQLRNAAAAAHDWEGTFRQNFIITKTTRTNNAGDEAQHGFKASGGIVGAAASGMTTSGTTLVGEHGPELVNLPPGTAVTSNPDTERILGQSGGGASGQPLLVQLVLDGMVLAQQLVEPTRSLVRSAGRGSVQTMYGQ